VICEQIEAMLNHVADAPDNCACYECARYLAVRAIMFQVFK
jgi:hypothetical protein